MDSTVHLDAKCQEPVPAIDWDAHCPDCTYCLRGLPLRSRCPECGFAYMAEPPRIETAVGLFERVIPRAHRYGIPAATAIRHPWLPVVLALTTPALVSIVFVVCLCLATKLGFSLAPKRYPPQANLVSTFGVWGTYGSMVRWNVYAIIFYVIYMTVGQLILVAGTWGLYAYMSLSVRKHGSAMRRLGTLASSAVPMLVARPLVALSVWQILSVVVPANGVFRVSWWSRWPRDMAGDGVVAVGLLILLFSSVWVARWIVTQHSACARGIREALLDVRADDIDTTP